MAADVIKRKVILIGDGAVGKTSLIRRFVMDKFDDRYITTIGTKVSKKELNFDHGGESTSMKLMVWDILGQQGYTAVQHTGYKGSKGAILVCDYTRKETMDSLENYWIPELQKVAGTIPMVFAGNKADLKDQHTFSEEELSAVAGKHGCPYISSSALTGENVEEMFLDLARTMMGSEEAAKDEQTSQTHEEASESEAATAVDEPEIGQEENPVEEEMDVLKASDWLITDFCNTFGDMESGMPVIRQQYDRVGVDVNAPTKKRLLQVVEVLARVESDYKTPEEVKDNKNRRLRVISDIPE